MTREEFYKRFQGRMLLFLTEAWTVRKLAPSELGLMMDVHARDLKGLLGEMYDALTPKPATLTKLAVTPNGEPKTATKPAPSGRD